MAQSSPGGSTTTPSPPIREPHVQQAITFLRDPRVRSEPLVRAVHFLRSKNTTEAEVREAFHRLKLPFPDANAVWQYYPPPPPPRGVGSVLLSALMNAAIAAGTLYALRELVRRYVIPMCFPELMDSEAIHRHSTSLLKRQEQQIEALRQTVDQLRASAESTDEKVERLSVTLSTASQLAERRSQETADLRNAIRMLSQSQTGSIANTPASNNVSGVGRANLEVGEKVGKEGRLSYAGTVQMEESRIVPTPETDRDTTPLITAPNTERKLAVDNQLPTIEEDDDDFMNNVVPAEVEAHWSAANASVASDKVSSNTASLNNIASAIDTDGEDSQREQKLATARRLFEESQRPNPQVNQVESHSENSAHRSTQSAPNPELPLSDDDL